MHFVSSNAHFGQMFNTLVNVQGFNDAISHFMWVHGTGPGSGDVTSLELGRIWHGVTDGGAGRKPFDQI